MSTLNGTYSVSLSFQNTSTTNTVGSATEAVSITKSTDLLNGTGSGQANAIWSYSGSLASTSTTFDLTTLPAAFGTLTLAKVKSLYIENLATTDGYDLVVGNAASNQWSAPWSGATVTETVPSGGVCFKSNPGVQTAAPWTVDSSHKSLKIDSGSHTVAFRIVIVGTQ